MFPMEGVRVASIGAMPPPVSNTVEADKREPQTMSTDVKPPTITRSQKPTPDSDEKSIDRIVIFYSDGTFSSYHP